MKKILTALALICLVLSQCCSPTRNVTTEEKELDRERRTMEFGLPDRKMNFEFDGNLTKTQLDSMIRVDRLDTITPVTVTVYKPHFCVKTGYIKATDSVTYNYTVMSVIKDSLYQVSKRKE